ncbi:hypothetical protein BCE75_109133 [Isoptericola sp. CG 20/1183]|uniref:Uncharacterized protein n=1 Tax=Isoptericola halotolerans TaxID=300560 RepID=A0ABX5EED9_9MICO|nr:MULTISPECIES: hypothetical protein [Isoptericola]PRZ04894.1 hypothetical protein BCL65_109134 [Isoptericola halotolerans]PRZ05385.1 hypothetical protein BCE75_109133 [Isoptericola sp. CG 20/1183]
MRLYVPATVADLDAISVTARAGWWDVPPRGAHAVTGALVSALPDEDDEAREYAAFLAAADASLMLVAGSSDAVPLRVVVTVEVPEHAVTDAAGDVPPSGVDVGAVPGTQVEAVHVDEPEAAADVRAVLDAIDAGDDEALAAATEQVDQRDLLWYHPTEAHQVPRP